MLYAKLRLKIVLFFSQSWFRPFTVWPLVWKTWKCQRIWQLSG